MEGKLPPTAYNVIKDQEYKGEIRVGLTFTPQVITNHYISTLAYGKDEVEDA